MRRLSTLLCLAALPLLPLSGCTLLPTQEGPPLEHYTLELAGRDDAVAENRHATALVPLPTIRGELGTDGMAYRSAHFQFGYFVNSRWADSPQAMLHALLIEDLTRRGPFERVVSAAVPVNPDYRVNLEILDFAQDFTGEPSEYRIRARLQLVDLQARRIVVERLLSVAEPSSRDDARGGAAAANRAVNRLLVEIHALLVEALPAPAR
jgi:cholesterol transport system auxiliary component